MKLKIKRAYEKAERQDGLRVLVDRLWPRGMKRDEAQIDLWLKDAAPSAPLRKWFNHEPDKWEEFKKRYFEELAANDSMLEPIRRAKAVTLVYGSKEERYNNAAALMEYLSGRSKKRSRARIPA
jgi:uncharacterized protein YeaO (DUF488 family)